MNKEHIHEMREMMIAKQVARIIPELKLVDAADFIAYIHAERFANITDIIDAATELHFYPHTMRFGNGGSYVLEWDTPPTITLDMEFSNEGVTAYFRLVMSADGFGIELDNVVFENPVDDETDTRHLMEALNDARLRKPN
ncbi:hypothetical protein [Bartonella sp. LJL80]